uniref:Uncharacterized protein n=1 Tax=Ditylenchus dipsaci TaxID=166011 RepID=A0A915ESN2_9BILA
MPATFGGWRMMFDKDEARTDLVNKKLNEKRKTTTKWDLKSFEGFKNSIYLVFRYKYFRKVWTRVVSVCLLGILVAIKFVMAELPLLHSPTTYILIIDLYFAIVRPKIRRNMTMKFCNYVSTNENFSQPYIDVYLDVKKHLFPAKQEEQEYKIKTE